MDAKSAIVVWNPQSSNGELGRNWPDLSRVLRREFGGFEAIRTQGPGDATIIARQAIADGADLVVAVGGDGTLNEVVNGFFDTAGKPLRGDVAVGLLPYGTGGDFRKTIQMPKSFPAAARALRWGPVQAIDVGHLRYTRRRSDGGGTDRMMFVNIASFGISGVVDTMVNATSKRFGGRLSFMLGTARAGLSYENQRVHMFFDGNESDHLDVLMQSVVVANGRYFGGGMKVAPKAELDDGQLDIITMADLSKLEFFLNGPKIYQGTHLSHPKVGYRRARSVDARPADPDEEILLDVDGETPGILPAIFTVLPRALRIVMPS